MNTIAQWYAAQARVAELEAALQGAATVIQKSLAHLPADGLAIHAGEWLGTIRETLKRDEVAP